MAARVRVIACGSVDRGDDAVAHVVLDAVLASPRAAVVDEMLTYTATGTPDEVAAYLEDFRSRTGADELMTVHYASTAARRLRSVELLAEAVDPAGVGA